MYGKLHLCSQLSLMKTKAQALTPYLTRFKPDKEGEQIQYTGISQSAIREMSLCSELSHVNLIRLAEIILEDKCIFMVFEYCEHDLLQIIQYHSQSATRTPIPASAVKSMLWQLLNGVHYLHTNWVLHRDLKPANIMVTSNGEVRIGDLGLARLFYKPLHSLYSGDKVVVTIWYRAPELLLGSKHYTPAIDLWAVGCIFGELLSLRPIFKGEEAKLDNKKSVPFQRNQMQKIVEILGMPSKERWPGLVHQQEYSQLQTLSSSVREHSSSRSSSSSSSHIPSGLETWYNNTLASTGYPPSPSVDTPGPEGLDLLAKLLEYDPTKRLTAQQAMQHAYFIGGGVDKKTGIPNAVNVNCFEGIEFKYPSRRVSNDDNDIRTASLPGTKRNNSVANNAGWADDAGGWKGPAVGGGEWKSAAAGDLGRVGDHLGRGGDLRSAKRVKDEGGVMQY